MGKIKDRILIFSLLITATLLIAFAALMAFRTISGDEYTSSIRKGALYLENGEYNKAIIAFKTAIDADDTQVEAYEGLAQAYYLGGYSSMAQDTVRIGLNISQTSKLLELQGEIGGSIGTRPEIVQEALSSKGSESTTEPELNESLLSFISGATFQDYKKKYGIDGSSVNGTTYTYTVKALNLELIYDNSGSINRINPGTGEPFDNDIPDNVHLTDVSYLFDTKGPVAYTKLAVLNYIQHLEKNENIVTFEACGCQVTLHADQDGTIAPDAVNNITILKKTEEEETQRTTLSGKIIDSSTGEAVPDVKIMVYEGYSASGEAEEAVTNSQGEYSLTVMPGDCYIVLEKTGYITESVTTYILSNASTMSMDLSISKELSDEVIKIVLSWDSSPRDLDSYLRGSTAGGQNFMISYKGKTAYDSSGTLIAELDLDDTDGYGPETTTLYDSRGSFNFTVVDYLWTGTMARSGATVKVYKGNALVETISITSDVENVWDVLDITDGNITVNNRRSDESASSASKS